MESYQVPMPSFNINAIDLALAMALGVGLVVAGAFMAVRLIRNR